MAISTRTKAAVYFVVAVGFAVQIAVNMATRARPSCVLIGFMLLFAGAGLTYVLRAKRTK